MHKGKNRTLKLKNRQNIFITKSVKKKKIVHLFTLMYF